MASCPTTNSGRAVTARVLVEQLRENAGALVEQVALLSQQIVEQARARRVLPTAGRIHSTAHSVPSQETPGTPRKPF